MTEILLYGALWFLFGLFHSLLAREGCKNRLKPIFGSAYRFIYNGVAVGQFILLYGAGYWLFGGGIDLSIVPPVLYVQYAILGAGWVLLAFCIPLYDWGRFLGLSQIREARAGQPVEEEEPLHFKGLHCWVRHPLYSATLCILWGGAFTDFQLWTALFASLYFWIGSIFEERALIRLYGTPYATYKKRVPAFVPFKGRQSVEDLNP